MSFRAGIFDKIEYAPRVQYRRISDQVWFNLMPSWIGGLGKKKFPKE